MLSKDIISSLNDEIPCRQKQILQLATLLDPAISRPGLVVVQGLEASGKSLTIRSILKALPDTSHVIVPSRECITGRHLLERTLVACQSAFDPIDLPPPIRCDSVVILLAQLRLLVVPPRSLVLVFDGIDAQRDASPSLLPALAYVSQFVQGIVIVLVVRYLPPRALHITGTPHVLFPSYDRSASLVIVGRCPPRIFVPAAYEVLAGDVQKLRAAEEDDEWLWTRFIGAIWDTLGQAVARDVVTFRRVCLRLWEPFVEPIRSELLGTRDFARLMVKARSLLQSEEALRENIISRSITTVTPTRSKKKSPILPFYTAHLLLAAYLASYTHSRHDISTFTKALSQTRRKRKPKTKRTPGTTHRPLARHLLGPQAFPLTRLLAIFRAIVPPREGLSHSGPGGSSGDGGGGDALGQVATLAMLRLLVRSAATGVAGSSSAGAGEVLDVSAGKWRVNVSREFAMGVARSVGFGLEDWIAE